jgi:hypothetical protein
VTDTTTMTPAEINAQLAAILLPPWDESKCRVCGWKIGLPHMPAFLNDVGRICLQNDCAEDPVPAVRADAPPDYCSDGMRRVLLAEIEKRGLQITFAMKLRRALNIFEPQGCFALQEFEIQMMNTWKAINVTMEQLARAALAALQESGK